MPETSTPETADRIIAICQEIDRLGDTAIAIRNERDRLRDRARCAAEIINIAKEALAAGEPEAAMRHLLRAQLELLA